MSLKDDDEVDSCQGLHKGNPKSIWPHKSVYVIKEMISTEQSYVTDLDNIIKVSFM